MIFISKSIADSLFVFFKKWVELEILEGFPFFFPIHCAASYSDVISKLRKLHKLWTPERMFFGK